MERTDADEAAYEDEAVKIEIKSDMAEAAIQDLKNRQKAQLGWMTRTIDQIRSLMKSDENLSKEKYSISRYNEYYEKYRYSRIHFEHSNGPRKKKFCDVRYKMTKASRF